jgi:glycogen operon protein
MVQDLHKIGLEVLLDVVYNHTGEGNQLGPTLCYRGIDNESYYVTDRHNKRFYYDSTGCGALFNLANPYVLTLVTDSMRYWYEHMGVDGFRLDLASSLCRVKTAFSSDCGFLAAVRQDPVLRQAKMIAEPWDVGADGYRIGAFPPSWGEWNDRFRDVVRRFWRGDERQVGELASRVAGSSDIFGYRNRSICSSVNFVTAHDGFNLTDLVSYNQKHNEANRENNHDGSDQNQSWNGGEEGFSTKSNVLKNRLLRRRALAATLLLSFGTPMIVAGDEFGQTHLGNNNPYCQNNVINWLVWDAIGAEDRTFARYVRRLIGLRSSLDVFERTDFFKGVRKAPKDFKDLAWYNELGQEFTGENWGQMDRRTLSYLAVNGTGLLLVILNAADTVQKWKLPVLKKTKKWQLLLDSSENFEAETPLGAGKVINLPAWSVLAMDIRL